MGEHTFQAPFGTKKYENGDMYIFIEYSKLIYILQKAKECDEETTIKDVNDGLEKTIVEFEKKIQAKKRDEKDGSHILYLQVEDEMSASEIIKYMYNLFFPWFNGSEIKKVSIDPKSV